MAAHQASHPWDSPGKNTGVGCHFLLQRTEEGSNNVQADTAESIALTSPGRVKEEFMSLVFHCPEPFFQVFKCLH